MANNSALAKDVIHRGNTRLLSTHPFYGFISCHFKLREENSQPTMATDNVHLFYNTDFVTKLTKPQVVGGLAHESMHVYLKHIIRGMDIVKDEAHWPIAQVAMDMAINPVLKDAGFELIEGAVYPPKEHWNESFEQHFKRLLKSAKKVPVGCGGGCSGAKPMPGGSGKEASPAERAAADAEMDTLIMNAASFARAAGKLPADIERAINALRAPKVQWQDVLRRFMQATAKNDYRMLPPNRRYIHQEMYLPSLRSETVGDVLLVIDGSGSTMHVFPQFISEFASILQDVRPERLHVMVWDTRCTWMRVFDGFGEESQENLAALQSEMGAGGGSVFNDTFDYFERESGITPQVAVVLTDMEIYFPDDPGYPVMWVATEDIEGPFGDTVRIEA